MSFQNFDARIRASHLTHFLAELHDQQSREIEQHLNSQHQSGLLQHTFESIKSVASSAWAYKPVRQSTGLEEFGLDNNELGGYEELPRQSQQMRGDFVFLEHFRLQPKRDGWGAVANLDLFFTVSGGFFSNGPTAIFLTVSISVSLSLLLPSRSDAYHWQGNC